MKQMMIEIKSVGAYSTNEGGKVVKRKLFQDEHGYYIKQNGCFPLALQDENGNWKINNSVPGKIAVYRERNHDDKVNAVSAK